MSNVNETWKIVVELGMRLLKMNGFHDYDILHPISHRRLMR